MKTKELNKIKIWFNAYVQTFTHNNGDLHPLLQLKADHSKRVAGDAKRLAKDLDWSSSDVNTMEALGWLHDVGRFPQFTIYKTFSDSESVNHGEYGWAVVAQTSILSSLLFKERNCILDSIRHHNAKSIPVNLDSESRSFLKLIRDADKLDILNIVLEAVEMDGFRDLPNMLPGITLDRSPSPQIVNEIITCQSVSLQNVKNLGDFLLMQLSWVYDLNYGATFQHLQDRNILPRLLRQLNGNSNIQAIRDDVRYFVRDHFNLNVQSFEEVT